MDDAVTTVRVVVEWPSAETQQWVISVQGTTQVGRSLVCGLRLPHPTVSAVHAALRIVSGQVQVRDEGSRFGTFVNQERCDATWHVVGAEDQLWLGDLALRLDVVALAAPERETATLTVTRALRRVGREVQLRLSAPTGETAAFQVSTTLPMRLTREDLRAPIWRSLDDELPLDVVEGAAGLALVSASGHLLNLEEGPQPIGAFVVDLVAHDDDVLASRVLPAPPVTPDEAGDHQEEEPVSEEVAAAVVDKGPDAPPPAGREVTRGRSSWVERLAIGVGLVGFGSAVALLIWMVF